MYKKALLVVFIGLAIGVGVFVWQVRSGKITLIQRQDISQADTDPLVDMEKDIFGGEIYFHLNQIQPGDKVSVESVKVIIPGYLVVFEDEGGSAGSVIGHSELLIRGVTDDPQITLYRSLSKGESIYVGLHTDNGDSEFSYPGYDIPVMTEGDKPFRKRYVVGK